MAEECPGLEGDSKELIHRQPLIVDIDTSNLRVLDFAVQKDRGAFPDIGA